MTTGEVTINLIDNGGAVTVPSANVAAFVGCSAQGAVATVVATRNVNVLKTIFGNGPMTQAAALAILKGGIVLACRATAVTAGLILGTATPTVPVTGGTAATPTVITAVAHGRLTGDVVTIAGVLGDTAANGTHRITKIGPDTFSLDGVTGNSAWTSGGTVADTGVRMVGTGTSVVTLTGTPLDDCNVRFLCTVGGTIATAGIRFKISLDAGRHYGPELSLGTAVTFLISDTGITLNFAAGTLVAGDTAQFTTVAPLWDTSAVNACLDALRASPYAVAGWGSGAIIGPASASDATTIQTKLNELAVTYKTFTRFQMSLRDASPPAAWGGTGETETVWSAALATAVSAVDAPRVLATGGHYNTPSAYPNQHGGSPSYRRPLLFSQAARQITLPPQRHSGRVRDRGLDTITVDAANDPSDGFVYHDEFFSPTLSVARICAARTRKGKPGYFIDQPYLLSAPGSQFDILPKGNVIDITCSIAQQIGENEINDDLTLNKNGTLKEVDAVTLETVMGQGIKVNQLDTKEISDYTVTVKRDENVAATKHVTTDIVVVARGYILSETINIGYSN